jgi:hypothetical protein
MIGDDDNMNKWNETDMNETIVNETCVYVRENFWSAGKTEIVNESRRTVGELDLLSAFHSGVNVLDPHGRVLCRGSFRFFSNKWLVATGSGEEIGLLKGKLSLFSKKFAYESYRNGMFTIQSPAFSREFDVLNEAGRRVARFEKMSGFFSSGAYRLTIDRSSLPMPEFICVVMGVNAIMKRRRSQAATT